jgi:hypothetical protein
MLSADLDSAVAINAVGFRVLGRTNVPQYVTHKDDWDILLVRIGHHLWREWKQSVDSKQVVDSCVLHAAMMEVWEAKERYRTPLKAAREANHAAAGARLKERRVRG